MQATATPRSVVDFWREAGPSAWFRKDEAFDLRFREAFLETHLLAARQALGHWAIEPEGALALLILLDQYPRNAFRGTATNERERLTANTLRDAASRRESRTANEHLAAESDS